VWALLIPVAYLLGTFPSAGIVARRSGIDITEVGSGNPGASNVTRALGWRKGALVFALDALKGAIAAGAGLLIDGRPAGYALGGAAIVGHMYPMMRRFHGGKGVATGAGVLVTLHPLVAVAAALGWFAVSRVTGKASVASIVAVVLVPLGLAVSDAAAWEYAATIAICALILVRHADNIRRLVRREEHSLT
jgi:acyl phosphate:glycerol-3-phosphate acyltransferase